MKLLTKFCAPGCMHWSMHMCDIRSAAHHMLTAILASSFTCSFFATARQDVLAGHHVFITGPAGTGASPMR